MNEPNLDRFAYGPPDRQDELPFAYCIESGDPIFYGEPYLLTDEGVILRDHFNTLINHYNVQRRWAGDEE